MYDPESDQSLLEVPLVDAAGQEITEARAAQITSNGRPRQRLLARPFQLRPSPQCLATPTHVALALAPRHPAGHGDDPGQAGSMPTHGPADAALALQRKAMSGPPSGLVDSAASAGLPLSAAIDSSAELDAAASAVGLGDRLPGERAEAYHGGGVCLADGGRGPALSSRGLVEADDEAMCIALRRILAHALEWGGTHCAAEMETGLAGGALRRAVATKRLAVLGATLDEEQDAVR